MKKKTMNKPKNRKYSMHKINRKPYLYLTDRRK